MRISERSFAPKGGIWFFAPFLTVFNHSSALHQTAESPALASRNWRSHCRFIYP